MKSKVLTTVSLCIIVMLAACGLSFAQKQMSDSWKKFQAKNATPGLQVVWDEQTNIPRMITGMMVTRPDSIEQPTSKSDISKIVFGFLDNYKKLMQITLEAVKEKKIWKFQDRWYVMLQTHYEDIPIFKGKVGFTLDTLGRILTYSSDYNPKMEIDVEPAISKYKAVEIAHQYHKPGLDLPITSEEVYLMIYQEYSSEGSTTYKLAWHIFLGTESGHSEVDRVFFVDAQTGKVIRDFYPHPQAITGVIQGEIYPEHSTDAVVIVPFEHEVVSVPGLSTYTNATGNYTLNPGNGNYTLTTSLEGPFVRVQSYNSVTATDQDIVHTANVNDPGTHNFTWTAANAAPDDGDGLNVFWHANRLHDDYYQAVLGINWNNNWTGTSRMNYSVNRGTINNAFAGNPITIYSDATARNCDIVYHETTHNILYDIFGGSYIGWPSAYSEGYAFDEGFADYVACSFNNDPVFAENVFSTRNCDNTMQYPGTTYNIEGHTGGQLISGVGWDLWDKEGLNHNATDVLLFAGLSQMATLASPYFFSNPNQSNYLTSLLIADDNNTNVSDGTPNDRQIFQAFRNHDLLPIDVFCKDSPQDDGNVPSAGQCWTSPDIWVRNNQDGGTSHENPIFNQANYLYVKVRNLGYLTANTIKVKAYWADPAGGIPWPTDWNYIGESTVNNLVENSETIATPIPWTPTGTAIGHRCLLVRLECNQDMMTEDGSIKLENNIAQKNISIISLPPGSPPKAVDMRFFVKNYRKRTLDLLIHATKIDNLGQPIESVPVPFTMELHISDLEGFQNVSGGKYQKGGGGCLFWLPFFSKPKFVLNEKTAKISSLILKDADKALSSIRLISIEELQAGDIFQVTIEQQVDEQIVGGLTYIIRVAQD
jgi:hypothetical protein